jgi:hypothetical protein
MDSDPWGNLRYIHPLPIPAQGIHVPFHLQAITTSLMAKCVGHCIGLPRVILDVQVIGLYQLKTSSLSHIQLSLSEEVLQTLVIGENVAWLPKQVMPPNLQSMNHSI